MNLTAEALKIMAAKGLTLEDVAEIVAATEKTRDPTAAERQARCRARKRGDVTRDVTRDPPPNESILTPTALTPTPSGVGPKADSAKSRGTRLPDNWALPAEWRDWAAAKRHWSVGEIDEEALLFANYWQARTGAGATHRDWFKTWQNWVLKSHRKSGAPKPTAEAVMPADVENMVRYHTDRGELEKAEECRRRYASSIGDIVQQALRRVA